ncbi:hypothetical protein CVD28_02360 [Bacillus sp. M6-12]|uniref:hypothetical protein n=1 Tax=Bacillus sp. M6-12 TaxID=2054166 RepID=UPI000C78D243|nr:hypothetical protein [Bacillus sp. M6-12]PLS19275.1 hypothetical protein CVD28_02360 [Bacillus sp. M6-12]
MIGYERIFTTHWWIAVFMQYPLIHFIVGAICILLPLIALFRGRYYANFCFWIGLYFLFNTEHFGGMKNMNIPEKDSFFNLHLTMLPCYIIGIVVWIIEVKYLSKKKRKEN